MQRGSPTVLALQSMSGHKFVCKVGNLLYRNNAVNIPFRQTPAHTNLNGSSSGKLHRLFLSGFGLVQAPLGVPLNSTGREMAALRMHPRLAACVVNASTDAKLAAAVMVAGLLDSEIRGGMRGGGNADLSSRLKTVLRAGDQSLAKYAARISKDAEAKVLHSMENDAFNDDVIAALGEALLPGFEDLVGQLRGKGATGGGSIYMLALGQTAMLESSGAATAEEGYVVVAETSTSDDGTCRIRSFISINEKILQSIAMETDGITTEPSKGHEVRARRINRVGAIELS